MPTMPHDDLLQQQIAYYRARAGEYDEWFLRQGRYDRGPDLNQRWFDEVAVAVRALPAQAARQRSQDLPAPRAQKVILGISLREAGA